MVLLGIALVTGLAAFVRLDGVSSPDRIYFDETYYVDDARSYLERGVEEQRPAHPPLGKWVIAAGIAVAGDDPFGWRIANVVLGTLTVPVTILAGRLLTRRWWVGLVAGLLVAVDGLALVSSRIGMLDASLAWWVAAGFLLLVIDRDRAQPSRSPALGPGRGPSGWRLGAGALLGCAVATKWSGAMALGAGALVALATDWSVLRAAWSQRRIATSAALRAPLLRLVLPFVVVPAGVYLASYGPWLASYPETETAQERCEEGDCGTGLADRLAGWWYEQRELVSFHQRLEATHPDRSHAWQWPVLDQPVLMFLERCATDAEECRYEPGEQRRILGLGNPALWWPALAAVPALIALSVRRRWWAGGAVLAFGLGQWAPWLASPKPGFSFYLIPIVPFAALSLALVCSAVDDRWTGRGRQLAVAVAVLAVVAAWFWWPFWDGSVLDAEATDRRAWLPSWD